MNRVKKQDENSRKFFGTNQSVYLDYLKTVKNNRMTPVMIQVIDQVPISQESDVEVNVHNVSGANRDVLNGQLTWNLNVEPSDIKTLNFDFTIKFPKNKKLRINNFGRVVCPKFRY